MSEQLTVSVILDIFLSFGNLRGRTALGPGAFLSEAENQPSFKLEDCNDMHWAVETQLCPVRSAGFETKLLGTSSCRAL
jgi:hypothetical protein